MGPGEVTVGDEFSRAIFPDLHVCQPWKLEYMDHKLLESAEKAVVGLDGYVLNCA